MPCLNICLYTQASTHCKPTQSWNNIEADVYLNEDTYKTFHICHLLSYPCNILGSCSICVSVLNSGAAVLSMIRNQKLYFSRQNKDKKKGDKYQVCPIYNKQPKILEKFSRAVLYMYLGFVINLWKLNVFQTNLILVTSPK